MKKHVTNEGLIDVAGNLSIEEVLRSNVRIFITRATLSEEDKKTLSDAGMTIYDQVTEDDFLRKIQGDVIIKVKILNLIGRIRRDEDSEEKNDAYNQLSEIFIEQGLVFAKERELQEDTGFFLAGYASAGMFKDIHGRFDFTAVDPLAYFTLHLEETFKDNDKNYKAMKESKCDSEIYENGRAVAMIDGRAVYVEYLVQRVRNETQRKCDWSYLAGRAIVRALPGDFDIVSTKFKEIFESNESIREVYSAVVYLGGDKDGGTYSWTNKEFRAFDSDSKFTE